MIAIISSTIYPPEPPPGRVSCVAPEERLEQTRETIRSLASAGFDDIYLADNSRDRWRGPDESYFAPARLLRLETEQFGNIGISEIHLLRRALREVPHDRPILKISGRYRLLRAPDGMLGDADVAARFYRAPRGDLISTRCYMVRSRSLHEAFLAQTLREMYAYQARVVGPRSLARLLIASISPRRVDFPYEDPPTAIELAACTVLRRGDWRIREVDELFIEGQAGSVPGLYVKE